MLRIRTTVGRRVAALHADRTTGEASRSRHGIATSQLATEPRRAFHSITRIPRASAGPASRSRLHLPAALPSSGPLCGTCCCCCGCHAACALISHARALHNRSGPSDSRPPPAGVPPAPSADPAADNPPSRFSSRVEELLASMTRRQPRSTSAGSDSPADGMLQRTALQSAAPDGTQPAPTPAAAAASSALAAAASAAPAVDLPAAAGVEHPAGDRCGAWPAGHVHSSSQTVPRAQPMDDDSPLSPSDLRQQVFSQLRQAASLWDLHERQALLQGTCALLRLNPSSFGALPRSDIQRLFVLLYMHEFAPFALMGGEPTLNPLPLDRKQRVGPRMRPDAVLVTFLTALIREADVTLQQFKAAPAEATTHNGAPVPTAAQARASVCALYAAIRGVGDSGVFAYLLTDRKCPNDRRRRGSPDGGNPDVGLSSWNKMDPLVFPHLAAHTRSFHAPLLLVQAQEVVRRHADMFLWPPAVQADGSDQTMSAAQVVAEAQEQLDQLPQQSPATATSPPSAAPPSSSSSASSSYPHLSPARNVVALVDLFQPLRSVHAPTRLVSDMLRVISAYSSDLVDQVRAARPEHFMRLFNHTVREHRNAGIRVMRAASPSSAEEDAEADVAEGEREEEAAMADEEEAEAAAAAAQAEEAEEETTGGVDPHDLAAEVNALEDAETDANAHEDAEAEADLVDSNRQPTTHPIDSTNSSSASSFCASAYVAPSSPASLPRIALHRRTLSGALSPSEMLLLVEAWASNNCVDANAFFCPIIRSYLCAHVHHFFGLLSLSQLHRWMLCLSTMEHVMLISERMLGAMTRFLGSECARTLHDTPIGVPQRVLALTAQRIEHAQRLDDIDELLAQSDGAEGDDPTPPVPAPSSFDLRDDDAASSSPPPMRLIHVLSSMFRAFGPISVVPLDVKMQTHLAPWTRKQLTSPGSVKRSRSLLMVSRVLCDYFIAIMQDERTWADHTAVSSQPVDPLQPPEQRTALLLLSELTQVAWSLVLMQTDRYAFVQHFLAHYTRWFDAHFALQLESGAPRLLFHGQEIEHSPPARALFRSMHQISLQIFLCSNIPYQALRRFMPSHGGADRPPPPPPSMLNFSSATRDVLMRLSHHSSDLSVSNFQLQVYQLMRDPCGVLQFRQRVLHSNLHLGMSHRIKTDLLAREAAFNAALPVEAHSPVMGMAASVEAEEMLQDRLDAHDALKEHTHEQGAVDFFVEHKTALGYIVDAALLTRFKQRPAKNMQTNNEPASTAQRLTSIPAIRAVLASSTTTAATAAAAAAPASASSSSSSSSSSPSRLRTLSVALEIDGVYHFCVSSPHYLRASSRLKHRQLRSFGWHVVHVPYFVWNRLPSDPAAQARWIADALPRSMLKEVRDERRETEEASERRRVDQIHPRLEMNKARAASLLRAKLAQGARPRDSDFIAHPRRD